MSKDYAISRAYDKIALVKKFENNPETQATAWTKATGYLEALLDMGIISAEEWTVIDRKLFQAFTGLED